MKCSKANSDRGIENEIENKNRFLIDLQYVLNLKYITVTILFKVVANSR